MPGATRQMALTADLVAAVARVVEDLGPTPGAVYMTDDDYEITIRETLENAPSGDIWLFGHGSLLWKPACEVAEGRRATVHGWHRAFCIRMARFRGTPERNGLMMALDRGGQCHGVIFRLPAAHLHESLDKLFRREMGFKISSNVPRWVSGRPYPRYYFRGQPPKSALLG
jgi:cation transport protein ChaC